MSRHRELPKGRHSIDAFRADLIAARGAAKRMMAIIDGMDSRGRADAGLLLEVACLAGMVQREMKSWADDMEEGS